MDKQTEQDVRSTLAWGQQTASAQGTLVARQTPLPLLSEGAQCSECATPVGALAETSPGQAAYDVVRVADWESWRAADLSNADSTDPFDLAASAPAPLCLLCAVAAMVAE